MRRFSRLWILTALIAGLPARADAVADKVEELEQKIEVLERRQELKEEETANQAKDSPKIAVGRDGFSFKSPDEAYQLKVRGYIHADGRFVANEPGRAVNDTFLIRRARPIFEATLAGRFDVRIMPDFGGGTTVLQDAYLDARFRPTVKLRAGKFKPPVGLERLQSATDIVFAERALPTNLVPNRDVGVQLHGEIGEGLFSYQVGAFNGVPDGSSADADTNESKDVAARVWFKPTKEGVASGLGFGLAATTGSQDGTLAATGLSSYRSASQQTFFSWRAGATLPLTVVASGDRTRISPQAWFYVGPFGVLAEYVRLKQEVALDTTVASIASDAWSTTFTWLLTGEKASYRSPAPRRPVEAKAGGIGAWEIVARYGRLRVDDDAFPVFANPATSSREAKEAAIGLNVHLNRNVKFVLDLYRTAFVGGAAAGADRPTETAVITRTQVAF